MAQTVFWFSIIFIFYVYLGYPFLLAILFFLRNRPVRKGNVYFRVSFIITAYNEEKRIGEKIENTLKQNYPGEKLEIIVASDCSADGTDMIVKSYESQGVKLVRATERKGKENAQKFAVDIASGEILIFSDVATFLKSDGVLNIVKNFNDSTVGCVSSIDRFIDKDGNISGEGAYVTYEMMLRKLESRVNTLVGLSGSFFAARKDVCHPWATDLQSDFNTLINAIKKGYRGVSDSESIGYYPDLSDEKKEFFRKVRTVVRGIRVFMKSFTMLNPFQYGLFSWQFISHKLCRWIVPFALLFALLSNALIVGFSNYYLYFFVLQTFFYIAAILGLCTHSKILILKIPLFFVMVNLSILLAWYKILKGEYFIKWEPSIR
jgi:glycosyltransferase involved in cell wall biosynthesis